MNKKYKWINFHMYEIPQLCKYFSSMARQGWMLEKYRLHRAIFRRCEPKDITFFMSINRRTTYVNVDYVSEEDQRFTDFVEEYGLNTVCRYSFYQIFTTDQDVNFPFYDESAQQYLQEHKKNILRYEWYYYIFPSISWLFLGLLWMFAPKWNSNLNIIRTLLAAFVMMLFVFPLSVPTLRWYIKKENYHTSVKSILARSQLTVILYAVSITALFLSILGESADLFLICFIILAFAMIAFSIVRTLLINKAKFMCYGLAMLATLLVSGTFTYMFLFPYHEDRVVDVIAPYVHYNSPEVNNHDFYISYKYTSFLYGEYDFDQKRTEDEVNICLIESKDKEAEDYDLNTYCNLKNSYTLYEIKNDFLESYLIDKILQRNDAYLLEDKNGYRYYEANYSSRLLVKGNKILRFYTDDTNEMDMDALMNLFQM